MSVATKLLALAWAGLALFLGFDAYVSGAEGNDVEWLLAAAAAVLAGGNLVLSKRFARIR